MRLQCSECCVRQPDRKKWRGDRSCGSPAIGELPGNERIVVKDHGRHDFLRLKNFVGVDYSWKNNGCDANYAQERARPACEAHSRMQTIFIVVQKCAFVPKIECAVVAKKESDRNYLYRNTTTPGTSRLPSPLKLIVLLL